MNIVLAHGILGFDKKLNVEYFNGIKKHIEDKHPAKVLTTEVSATGSIKMRGDDLRKQILESLKNGQLKQGEKMHIIAHSMGGLDSRYILSPDNKDNIADHITSLTTIGTPHQGSPIADLLSPILDGKAHFSVAEFIEEKEIEVLKFFGILTDGLHNLTTEAMMQFEEKYSDSPDVNYFWNAGIGRKGKNEKISETSWPFLPTYKYIYEKGQALDDKLNDGVVPLSSAKRDKPNWEQIGSLWNFDHAEEVGHDLDKTLSPGGVLTALTGGLLRHDSRIEPPNGLLDRYDEIITRISLL